MKLGAGSSSSFIQMADNIEIPSKAPWFTSCVDIAKSILELTPFSSSVFSINPSALYGLLEITATYSNVQELIMFNQDLSHHTIAQEAPNFVVLVAVNSLKPKSAGEKIFIRMYLLLNNDQDPSFIFFADPVQVSLFMR